MNNLQQAYVDLGIPIGSSLEAVERRYKRLVMAWHPDRYPNEEHKREAEEELKKINNAKDLLKEHLKGSQHKDAGECDCRMQAGAAEHAQSRQPGSSGPGRKAKTTAETRQEEFEAKFRDAERSRRAQEEQERQERQRGEQAAEHAQSRQPGSSGPGRKAKTTAETRQEEFEAKFRDAERSRRAQEEQERQERQRGEQAAEAAHEESVKTAFRQESQRSTESLRWKICLGSAAVSILLMFVPSIAYLVEQPILAGQNVIYGQHGESAESRKLAEEWRSYQNDKAQVATSLLPQLSGGSDTTIWRPPFVSNDASADYISRQAYQELVLKVEEQKKQHAMEVYKARSEVDRYQKAIERSQSVLADCAAKLADPNSALTDQRITLADQADHRRYLQENQENLRAAQKRLDELEAESPGAVPLEPRFGPAQVQ